MKPLKSLSEDKMKVKIPKHWTPEQAQSVIEFVTDIEIALRKEYQTKIMAYELSELYRQEKTDYDKKKREDADY
jgi:uncharacterized protein YktA (UPF0223 family)